MSETLNTIYTGTPILYHIGYIFSGIFTFIICIIIATILVNYGDKLSNKIGIVLVIIGGLLFTASTFAGWFVGNFLYEEFEYKPVNIYFLSNKDINKGKDLTLVNLKKITYKSPYITHKGDSLTSDAIVNYSDSILVDIMVEYRENPILSIKFNSEYKGPECEYADTLYRYDHMIVSDHIHFFDVPEKSVANSRVDWQHCLLTLHHYHKEGWHIRIPTNKE